MCKDIWHAIVAILYSTIDCVCFGFLECRGDKYKAYLLPVYEEDVRGDLAVKKLCDVAYLHELSPDVKFSCRDVHCSQLDLAGVAPSP